MLFLIQNAIVCLSPASPLPRCQGVLHPAMEYAHDGESSGGQLEAASGSFFHLEWPGIWQLIVLTQARLESAKSSKKKSVKKPSSLRKQSEIISTDTFWNAVTPDYEELQPEQKNPLNSGPAVHSTTI